MKRKVIELMAIGLLGIVLFTTCLYGNSIRTNTTGDELPVTSENEIVLNDSLPIVIDEFNVTDNSETVSEADMLDELDVEISSDLPDNEIHIETPSESPNINDTHTSDKINGSENNISSNDKGPGITSSDKNVGSTQKPTISNDKKPTSSSTSSSTGSGSSAQKLDRPSSGDKMPAQKPSEPPTSKEDSPSEPKPAESEKPEKPVHTHSYSSEITRNATYNAEGLKTFTCTCGNSYSEKIPKTDHTWEAHTTKNWVVDKPAYSEPVKTVYGGYKCNTCGTKYSKEDCEAGLLIAHQKETDHSGTSSWSDFKITTIKHEEEGHYEEHTTYTCSVCGTAK